MDQYEWAESHYGFLGVSPLPSLEEICRARDYKLMKNPVGHRRINAAFSTLTDDVSRETYNEKIGLGDKTEMLHFAFYHYHHSISRIAREMELEIDEGDFGQDETRYKYYQDQINKLKVPDITKLLEWKKPELSVHEKACTYQDNLSKLGPDDLGTLLRFKGLDVPELQHQKVNSLMTHAGYKWTNDKETR